MPFPDIRNLSEDEIGGQKTKLGFNIFQFQVSVKHLGRDAINIRHLDLELRKQVHNRYKFGNHHIEVLAEAIKGRVRNRKGLGKI